MIVNSDNLIHVFIRGKTNQDHVVTFVCRKSANMGMVLTKARSAMPEIEASL
jgi:glycerol-3-phosphate responsive antiterminator